MNAWAYSRARMLPFRLVKHDRHKAQKKSILTHRHLVLYLYAALFLALTALLGKRLQKWDPEEEGHCYNNHLVSGDKASHPDVDHIYLGISSGWMFMGLLLSVITTEKRMRAQIVTGLLQYPLHVYFMIALRESNTHHLTGTESEDDWKFGQTISVVLLCLTIGETVRGLSDLRIFEKKAKTLQMQPSAVEEGKKEDSTSLSKVDPN